MNPADPDAFALLARQLGLPNGNRSQPDPRLRIHPIPRCSTCWASTLPGTTFEMYGDDTAKLLKGGKNLYLNFNIHYQPPGSRRRTGRASRSGFSPGLRNISCFGCLPQERLDHRRRQRVD